VQTPTFAIILLVACGCENSGEGSCFMRERADDHSIISCAETPDLSADEYSKQDPASPPFKTGDNAL
jgi:hypothetical protein